MRTISAFGIGRGSNNEKLLSRWYVGTYAVFHQHLCCFPFFGLQTTGAMGTGAIWLVVRFSHGHSIYVLRVISGSGVRFKSVCDLFRLLYGGNVLTTLLSTFRLDSSYR